VPPWLAVAGRGARAMPSRSPSVSSGVSSQAGWSALSSSSGSANGVSDAMATLPQAVDIIEGAWLIRIDSVDIGS
jgi:hypothetical protein